MLVRAVSAGLLFALSCSCRCMRWSRRCVKMSVWWGSGLR